jgi:hypothetical protein
MRIFDTLMEDGPILKALQLSERTIIKEEE